MKQISQLACAGIAAIGCACFVQAAESDERDEVRGVPFEIRNHDEPERIELLIFAKSFCVAMRRMHDDADAGTMREFIDSDYLGEHGLGEGELPIRMAAVGPIYDIKVADDMRTVLCIVGTAGDEDAEPVREALVLRVVVRDGQLRLKPAAPPDSESGSFVPWILRTDL